MIKKVYKSRSTIEGAGVHLKRAFGFGNEAGFDPFLLLDDFCSNNRAEYINGFPWHPHRGIETITYVLKGSIEHQDSLGNHGIIQAGDVQWMTAGSGIIHQEMADGDENGSLCGFQLWLNLPSSHKMMPPRYRDIKKSLIPEFTTPEGACVKLISGDINGIKGPVQDVITRPQFMDITVPPNTEYRYETQPGYSVFIYVIEGKANFNQSDTDPAIVQSHADTVSTPVNNLFNHNGDVLLFEIGQPVHIMTTGQPVRILLASGKPIDEPIIWYGPIVMNSREEILRAIEDYQNGTFTNHVGQNDQPVFIQPY